MDLAFVRLLKIAAVIGMSLSLTGLLIMLGIRIEEVATGNPFQRSAADSFRHVLDGLKEAGVTMLLSSLLFVACVIAQRLPRTTADEPVHTGD